MMLGTTDEAIKKEMRTLYYIFEYSLHVICHAVTPTGFFLASDFVWTLHRPSNEIEQ